MRQGGGRSQRERLRRRGLGKQEGRTANIGHDLCPESCPNCHFSAPTQPLLLWACLFPFNLVIQVDPLNNPRGMRVCKLTALGHIWPTDVFSVTCRALLNLDLSVSGWSLCPAVYRVQVPDCIFCFPDERGKSHILVFLYPWSLAQGWCVWVFLLEWMNEWSRFLACIQFSGQKKTCQETPSLGHCIQEKARPVPIKQER